MKNVSYAWHGVVEIPLEDPLSSMRGFDNFGAVVRGIVDCIAPVMPSDVVQ